MLLYDYTLCTSSTWRYIQYAIRVIIIIIHRLSLLVTDCRYKKKKT